MSAVDAVLCVRITKLFLWFQEVKRKVFTAKVAA